MTSGIWQQARGICIPHLAKLQQQLPLILLSLFVLIIFIAHAAGLDLRVLQQMENHAFDLRMQLSTIDKPDPRFVIVDIDEKSLEIEGRWPWSRNKLEQLIDNLFEYYQVQQVGFDIVFAEPDTSSGLKILEDLGADQLRLNQEFQSVLTELSKTLDYDRRLAKSISKRPVVLGYYFNKSSELDRQISGTLPQPTFTNESLGNKTIPAPEAGGYGANLAIFQEQALAAGHFNPHIDDDGIIRRVPLLYNFKGDYYESLSLAMVRTLVNADRIEPMFSDEKLEWLKVGNYRIPVTEGGMAIVPYRGMQGSFPYIPATDILDRKPGKSVLENTIVMVGTSAPGLFDLRSTPLQSSFPGVEIHVNLIAGMLDQRIMKMPELSNAIEVLTMLIVGLLFILVMPVLTPFWTLITSALLFLILLASNLAVWFILDYVIPIAPVLILLLILFLFNMSFGFFIERSRKAQITGLFGQYVPPELVDEMSDNPDSFTREADEREMTVLFSDVRGFTTLSEGLNPKELSDMMNEFLTAFTTVIHRHRGTIDKYMGDAIMAFWGAPLSDPEHARHAVEACLDMIKRMYELHEEFPQKNWPALKIGVGINTGTMSVGNMGSEFRMAYTVIGDSVNLGSRLEGLTKQYGVDALISESTRNMVPDHVFREIDLVRVKGKHEPVAIYEPLGHRDTIQNNTFDELDLHQRAIDAYRKRDWDKAKELFRTLALQFKQRKIYSLYLERIQFFTDNPPGEDWDGVFTFTVK